MDPESIMLSETSRRGTDNIWCNLYVESTNKQAKKTQTHKYREQVGGCQRQEWGVGKTGEGGQKYKLLILK